MEIIASCIAKKPALMYGKINFLMSCNSSRHDHMFLIFPTITWYNLKNSASDLLQYLWFLKYFEK